MVGPSTITDFIRAEDYSNVAFSGVTTITGSTVITNHFIEATNYSTVTINSGASFTNPSNITGASVDLINVSTFNNGIFASKFKLPVKI